MRMAIVPSVVNIHRGISEVQDEIIALQSKRIAEQDKTIAELTRLLGDMSEIADRAIKELNKGVGR